MWNLITLDGFFEGPEPWDLDWHDDVWGDELDNELSGSQSSNWTRPTCSSSAASPTRAWPPTGRPRTARWPAG